MFTPHAPRKPILAFLGALALIVFGLAVVPMTVQAVSLPLSLTCSNSTSVYDPGYGVGQLAVTPTCTLVSQR